MAYCFVAGTLGPDCPAVSIARGLAGLGLDVHLILPEVPGAGSVVATRGVRVYALDTSRPSGIRSRFLWRYGGAARLLRSIGPEVVHCGPEAAGFEGFGGRGHRPIVLRSVAEAEARPTPSRCDAGVLPDGRLVDRAGRPLVLDDLPPRPIGSEVDDGIDPGDAARHWGLMAFLAGVDHLRRSRRVRRDRPEPRAGLAPRGFILRASVGPSGAHAVARL